MPLMLLRPSTSSSQLEESRNVRILLNNLMWTDLTDVDMLAAIVAALIHDIDHPGTKFSTKITFEGVNNAFEIATASPRALIHNDMSVLENHHLSTGFRILFDEQNNIFSHLAPEIYPLH